MQVLPLDDVPAVKVYLGLPLFGKRVPSGGIAELIRRQKEDVGMQVFAPVVVGASEELPRVIHELERRGCMHHGEKIGLFGFSAGGAAALLATAEQGTAIGTVVLLNPSTGLTSSVLAFEKATGQTYAWTAESRALAARTDSAGRAADIARGSPLPALLLIEGDRDNIIANESLSDFEHALMPLYANAHAAERFQVRVLQALPHNIVGSHSDDELGRQVSGWFKRY